MGDSRQIVLFDRLPSALVVTQIEFGVYIPRSRVLTVDGSKCIIPEGNVLRIEIIERELEFQLNTAAIRLVNVHLTDVKLCRT
jgi:hypothetical protein